MFKRDLKDKYGDYNSYFDKNNKNNNIKEICEDEFSKFKDAIDLRDSWKKHSRDRFDRAILGIVRKAILHIEPSSIYQFCYKSYQYGKSTKQLRGTNLYLKLLNRKALLRKGIKLDQRSIESIILFLIRNILKS